VKDSSGSPALQVAPNRSFALTPNDLSKGLEPLVDSPNDGHRSCPVVQKAAREKETRPFGSPEAADSGSSEEGIDAEKNLCYF